MLNEIIVVYAINQSCGLSNSGRIFIIDSGTYSRMSDH